MNGWENNTRVLVTGASGFLGAHLVRRLLKECTKVFVILRSGTTLFRLESVKHRLQIRFGDLCDVSSVLKIVRESRPEIVFHLAATGVNPRERIPRSVLETNVLGTMNLLEACRGQELHRIVHVGSCFEYGNGLDFREDQNPNPHDIYAVSKVMAWLLARMYAQHYGLPVVMLRPFTAYGPWERMDRLIPTTILHALQGRILQVTAGEQERDWVYVEDLIDGFILAASKVNVIGETINLCSGRGTPVRDVVRRALALMGDPIEVSWGAIPYREDELWRNSGNPVKAKRILGWMANTSLDVGLQRTIAWHRDNLNEIVMRMIDL
ncbi:MAG: NAD(P)-dependent oxidoreductase [candidate division KSB1 bacterium]|nr:NAD(P)-dependent oxidoreductase [candidate division KSB1 bacterium]